MATFALVRCWIPWVSSIFNRIRLKHNWLLRIVFSLFPSSGFRFNLINKGNRRCFPVGLQPPLLPNTLLSRTLPRLRGPVVLFLEFPKGTFEEVPNDSFQPDKDICLSSLIKARRVFARVNHLMSSCTSNTFWVATSVINTQGVVSFVLANLPSHSMGSEE